MKYIFYISILFAACKKDSFITGSNAALNVSNDSLYFDTLFTSAGSVTQLFKIYNGNDQKLRVSNISVSNGSFFKINADGRPGPQVNNLEMDANDSLYVFVSVLIDPTTADLPYVVEDSIRIDFNGNTRWVKLSAWGQNANFIRSQLLTTNTTWTNERPYVILGGLGIEENTTLTIEKGTRIYLHADAPILVDGTINAIGEKYDSTKIIFQGDRLDEGYRDYPGAWPGIYFGASSKNNLLKHVIIKNAYQGVVAEDPSPNSSPKLTLKECIIDNCYDAGIIASQSSVSAVNCLVSNCGKNIMLLKGGEYNFTHCTNVAISNSFIQHKQPGLAVTNFIKVGETITSADIQAEFTNCIFWGENGTVDNEVVVGREGNNVFDVNFSNCLWKNITIPENITATNVIANEDPLFTTVDTQERIYNFRLREGSPGVGTGKNAGILQDMDGNERNDTHPDMGAYESTF